VRCRQNRSKPFTCFFHIGITSDVMYQLRIEASKICDCLRYRNLLVRQMVQMKHKIGMLLMKAGASYNKQRLHNAGYFRELLATNPDIDEGLRVLLRQCRETMERLSKTEGAVLRVLIVVHQIQIEDRDVALPA
jgi:hypothetical protein